DAVASLAGAFSSLSDKLIDMASDQLINGLLGSFMGIFGGGSGLGSGAFGRGTYGGSGGFFPAFPGFANGTMSAPGGMAWVGERGPELVNLPRGSQVIPNHALRGGGKDRVLVELGPGLEGRILQKSGQQSVQLIQSTVPGMIDSQAPSAVKRSERNRVTS